MDISTRDSQGSAILLAFLVPSKQDFHRESAPLFALLRLSFPRIPWIFFDLPAQFQDQARGQPCAPFCPVSLTFPFFRKPTFQSQRVMQGKGEKRGEGTSDEVLRLLLPCILSAGRALVAGTCRITKAIGPRDRARLDAVPSAAYIVATYFVQ